MNFSKNRERTTPLFAIFAIFAAFFSEGSRGRRAILTSGIARSRRDLLIPLVKTALRPRKPSEKNAAKMAFFRFSVFVIFFQKFFFAQKFFPKFWKFWKIFKNSNFSK